MSLKLNYLFRSTRRHRRESGNAIAPQDPYRGAPSLIDFDVYDEAAFEEAVSADFEPVTSEELIRLAAFLHGAQRELVDSTLASSIEPDLLKPFLLRSKPIKPSRPPFNAEYLLYLFLHKDERDSVIGDLIESHAQVVARFNKRRGDIWFYKQVAFSLFPLVCRAVLKIGGLVRLGRVLRRLIS